MSPVSLVLLISTLVLLAGCLDGSARTSDDEAARSAELTPTATIAAAGSGQPSTLESSVAMIREIGSDEALGSGVVIRSDGLLVTASDVAAGNIEVVLPDGQIFRPVLVATEPAAGLALLKVPADRLVPVRFSTNRMPAGSDVYAVGYDGAPATIGRMSGEVLGTVDEVDGVDYHVRGPMIIDTDVTLVSGFRGGVLSDDASAFAGVLVPGEDDEGRSVARAVSNWVLLGWLDSRQDRLNALADESDGWETIELPGGWSMHQPDGWSNSVGTDSDDSYRSEMTPADLDAGLQIAVSVEPNDHGTDPERFLAELFGDRSSATVWGVERVDGRPLVRLSMIQEGALVDVAYVLDREYLIAVSLTSAYLPESDPEQVDQARALFETVLTTIAQF